MDNLALLLIVGAGLLVVGSMAWVLPSPRERAQMKLRQRAMALGIEVRLSKIDDPLLLGEIYRCCAYRRNRPKKAPQAVSGLFYRASSKSADNSANGPETQAADVLAPSGWRVKGSRLAARDPKFSAVFAILNRLPDNCRIVEINPLMAAIYWQEQGSEQDVETIRSVLEAL